MSPLRPVLVLCLVLASSLRAEWQREFGSLAWTRDGAVVWKFSFDPKEGKPHFATGESLDLHYRIVVRPAAWTPEALAAAAK